MCVCVRMFAVRGVIRVDVNIQDIDLDQCVTGESCFADTHQCNRTTMEVKARERKNAERVREITFFCLHYCKNKLV